jgi:hypothetical protein
LSVTGINQLTSFYFDQESSILLSGTVTGSLFIECHRYKPAYFFLF